MITEIVLDKVVELTAIAREYILKEQNKFSFSNIEKKGLNYFVTYFDKGSERILIEGLNKILPRSGVLAEESGGNTSK